MTDDIKFVCTGTGRQYKKFYRQKLEVGPDYWFVKDYYLYVNLAHEHFKIHVGAKKLDRTKNIKVTVDIPIE